MILARLGSDHSCLILPVSAPVLGISSLALSLEASAKKVGYLGDIINHTAYHCEDAERLARSKAVTEESKCRARFMGTGKALRNIRSVVKGCHNNPKRAWCNSTCQVDVALAS